MRFIAFMWCLLTTVVPSFAQEDGITLEPEIPISHSFWHYYSSDTDRAKFEEKINNTYFFDRPKSIQNLIDQFGPEFFLLSDDEAKQLLNDYLMTHSNFDKVDTASLVKSIASTQKALINVQPESDLSKFVNDRLITYHSNAPRERNQFLPPYDTYSYLWDYETKFDTTRITPYVVNIERIYDDIYAIDNVTLRTSAFFLFLKNLYADENWSDLLQGANHFVNMVMNQENAYSVKGSRGLEIKRSDGQVELHDPVAMMLITDDEQKVRWIIQTVKLLASRSDLDTNYDQFLAHCFGVLFGLTQDKPEMLDWYILIQELEIQFLIEFGKLEFTETAYYDHSFNMVNSYQEKGLLINRERFIRYNVYLAQISLNWWTWNKVNSAEYPERQQLQTAQFLFQTIKSLNEDPAIAPTAEVIRFKAQLYQELARYFDINDQEDLAVEFAYQNLDQISDYPSFFDNYDYTVTLGILGQLLYEVGAESKAEEVLAFLDQESREMVEASASDIEAWPSVQKQEYAMNILANYNSDSQGFQETVPPSLYPILNRALLLCEVDFVQSKKYKEAYRVSRFRLEVLVTQAIRTYSEYEGLRERGFNEVLRISALHQKKLLDDKIAIYTDALVDLDNTIKSKEFDLVTMNSQIQEKEQDLTLLNDSVIQTQQLLDETGDKLIFWKDTATIIVEAKEELQRAYELLEISDQENKRIGALYLNVSRGLVVLFFITMFFAWRAMVQKRKVDKQAAISESLRFAIGQVAHIGKNSLNRLVGKYYVGERNRSLPETQAIKNIADFFQQFENSNAKAEIVADLQQEINLGLQLSKVDFSEDFLNTDMRKLLVVDETTAKDVKVPIYTVMNLIYNSFKHSKRKSGINIDLQIQKQRSYTTIRLRDYAQKFDSCSVDKKGHGTKYIEKILSALNPKRVKPKFSRTRHVDGYSVEFNISPKL